MAHSVYLSLAISLTMLDTVESMTRGFMSEQRNNDQRNNSNGPLPFWVFPIIAIAGLIFSLFLLYFLKKLFAGQRTIKLRNSLRNRPQSPWINRNRDTGSDRGSDAESRDLPPVYEPPPSYIEVTKEFQAPPPPSYEAIFQSTSAVIEVGLLAELAGISDNLGSTTGNRTSHGHKHAATK